MAYYEKRWNIYTAQFLMKQTVLDEHQNGSVLSETYYIEIQLMKHDNPEAAYKEVNKWIETKYLDDSYKDDNGNVVQLTCLGLKDFDLFQMTIDDMKKELEDKLYGITLTTINIDNIPKKMPLKKEDLSLFDKYYNYKP